MPGSPGTQWRKVAVRPATKAQACIVKLYRLPSGSNEHAQSITCQHVKQALDPGVTPTAMKRPAKGPAARPTLAQTTAGFPPFTRVSAKRVNHFARPWSQGVNRGS